MRAAIRVQSPPRRGAPTRASAVRGASMVEYILVLGAVVLTAVLAFSLFGDDVRGAVTKEGQCVEALQAGCTNGGGGYPLADAHDHGVGAHPDIFVGTEEEARRADAERALLPPVTPEIVERARALVSTPSTEPRAAVAVEQVVQYLAQLPRADLEALESAGVTYVLSPDSIAAALPPELTTQTPAGFPPGSSFANAVGVYRPSQRQVILAFDANGDIVLGGSRDTIGHETGHALDHARGANRFWQLFGYPARESDSAEFVQAWSTDVEFLPHGEGPLLRPYARLDGGGLAEAYADAYLMYHRETRHGGNAMSYNYPNLFEFFRSRDPDGPSPRGSP